MIGTVYKSTGSWYIVKTIEGAFIECRIKGSSVCMGLKVQILLLLVML